MKTKPKIRRSWTRHPATKVKPNKKKVKKYTLEEAEQLLADSSWDLYDYN